jgi:hypothetical protein
MKVIKYLLVGFLFGIVLTKSEAVSWYEFMKFQFDHMYGIIMVAILTGIIGIQIMKKGVKDIGIAIEIKDRSRFSALSNLEYFLDWVGLL